ncbi:hypothetical protein [Roseobacter fucihabitans]|uniref:hypothetical protein n=1 Tax=Roseobacter fucihabitans TaxID=1537242 RepID=UPI001652F1C2|nr:hypothetical protein [Roseobacter litoralis]
MAFTGTRLDHHCHILEIENNSYRFQANSEVANNTEGDTSIEHIMANKPQWLNR